MANPYSEHPYGGPRATGCPSTCPSRTKGPCSLSPSSLGRVWSKVGLLVVSCSTYRMKNLSFLLFLFFLVPGLLGSSMPLCPMDEAINKKINQDFSSLCEDLPRPHPILLRAPQTYLILDGEQTCPAARLPSASNSPCLQAPTQLHPALP